MNLTYSQINSEAQITLKQPLCELIDLFESKKPTVKFFALPCGALDVVSDPQFLEVTKTTELTRMVMTGWEIYLVDLTTDIV